METNWLDKAKCRDMDPKRFDLLDRRIYGKKCEAEAKRLCHGCEVVQPCAAEAITDIGYRLQSTTRAGVWVPDQADGNHRVVMAELVDIAKGAIPC